MSALRGAALAAALLAASTANAARSTSPLHLADIAQAKVAADPPAPPDGTKMPSVRVKTNGGQTEVTIAQEATTPACLYYTDATMTRPMWVEPGMRSTYGTSFRAERILTSDGRTELERSMIEVSGDTVRVTGRQRIPLTEIAKDARGLVVYAYRTAGELWVLAPARPGGGYRNATASGELRDLDQSATLGTYDCGFVAARMNLRGISSATAVLSGFVPTPTPDKAITPPRFVVNASVSKVSRDPEPLLSVNVRVVGPDEPR